MPHSMVSRLLLNGSSSSASRAVMLPRSSPTKPSVYPARKHRISCETLSQKTQLSGSLSRTRTLNRVLRQHPVKHLSHLSRNLRRHLHRTTTRRKRTRRHQQLMN